MAKPDPCNRPWIRSGILCFSLSLFALSAVMAQVGQYSADEPGGRLKRPAAPVYDVIALRVEFQPDDSRFSTGDGVFGGAMFEDLNPRIDPFPHDAAYFDAHLNFLASYVEHVSRGQTVVRTHLIPEIVRVSGRMGDYAPVGPDSDGPSERAKLVALVQEAWTLADQQATLDVAGLSPEHTAFILFHAGTGRDIELTGTTLDRTPEDLPSLFLGPESLDGSGNSLLFKGLLVNNTTLIPETESKRGVDLISDEPFLLELSINGLLAASFFNYLGVPDLFDTKTGTSAIGPYGLMDPLGIFAYGGLLPPEPSAWTRFYLGWSTPVELSGSEPIDLELRAGVDQALVPVSSSEFFLVEVRHRDVQSDGLNLKIWKDGVVLNQHFDADAADFTAFNQDGFEGVLISADDYDWALPGGFDDIGTLRQGGILIWHIDERQIADGLETNSVNVDPTRRGVDLEEADSAQDLGFPSGNPFAPEFDRGTPFDFFFEGNPITTITATGEVVLYVNRFGPDTYPNSNSNGGGPSFVTLDNFGPAGATMTLRYSRAVDEITLIEFEMPELGFPFGPASSVSKMSYEIGPARLTSLILHSGPDSKTLWFVPTGDGVPSRIDGVLGKPVVHPFLGGADAVAYLVQNDVDEVLFARFDPILYRPSPYVPLPAEVRLARPSTPLVGFLSGNEAEYYVGFDLGEKGYVVQIHSDLTTELHTFSGGGVVSLAALEEGSLLVASRDRAQKWNRGAIETEWLYPGVLGSAVGQIVAGRDGYGSVAAITAPDEGRILILGDEGRVVEVTSGSDRVSPFPILLDADADGLLDVLVTSGRSLRAFSREGAEVRGFPIALPAGAEAQPVIATFEGEDTPYVLLGLTDGYLYAYGLGDRPELREGFPLPVGGYGTVTPLIIDNKIYTSSSTGALAGWEIPGLVGVGWSSLYGNGLNWSFVDGGTEPPSFGLNQDLIVDDETYNWPNPVRDGVTHLRVASTEPGALEVVIVDLAGGLVYSMESDIQTAGVPIEFEWRPDVASGVYFARVTIHSVSGRKGTKLYSIAVIR